MQVPHYRKRRHSWTAWLWIGLASESAGRATLTIRTWSRGRSSPNRQPRQWMRFGGVLRRELLIGMTLERGQSPRWDAEVVSTAAALAMNDYATAGKLNPLTRQALDRMWTLQKPDGGFDWLKCGWPPYEHDDYYGAIVAALGVGHAAEGYALTPAAQFGMKRLQIYFSKSPAPTLHHRVMLMWASMCVEGLMTAAERRDAIARLRAAARGRRLESALVRRLEAARRQFE